MCADRLPPQNQEAEQSVLGSLLIDPDAIIKIASFLNADDFYREIHQYIFRAMADLHERRQPTDFVTVVDELERSGHLEVVGGSAYLSELIGMVPTSVHVEHYGHIVERTALMRRLISAAGEIAALAYQDHEEVDEVIDKAESILFDVGHRRVANALVPISEIVSDYFERVSFMARHPDQSSGVHTGFKAMDDLLGGMQPSDLLILAARPGIGKSSLAVSIAANAALKDNAIVAIFTLEMSGEQLVQRMLSSHTGIDAQRLRLGRIGDSEWTDLTHMSEVLSKTKIFIDDSPSPSPMEIRTKARRLAAEYSLDLIHHRLSTAHARRRSPQREPRPRDILHLARAQGAWPVS